MKKENLQKGNDIQKKMDELSNLVLEWEGQEQRFASTIRVAKGDVNFDAEAWQATGLFDINKIRIPCALIKPFSEQIKKYLEEKIAELQEEFDAL